MLLYQLQLDGKNKPQLLVTDTSPLLNGCKPDRCSEADQFHPTYDFTGGNAGQIAFGFWAWMSNGLPFFSFQHRLYLVH